ncbi:MAG TPA: shikimate kinase [Terriglobales bacterium]|nr:shikimate kinase [Terriglobales bacterium]
MQNRFGKSKTGSGSRPAVKPLARERVGSRRSIFLVGFMGAGKTTVGRALSRRLGLPFEDLDERIQQREGKTIERIFRESGEAGFRKAETAALREVLADFRLSTGVVALGGGAFVQPENAALIEQVKAHSIFLDAPVDELLRRCDGENKERPLRQDAKQFRELYEKRRLSYMKAAIRIDTDGKDVDAIAAEVACSLGLE